MLSSAEIEALRAAVAQRSAGGRALTPQEAALLRAAAGSTARRPGTSGRPPGRRTSPSRRTRTAAPRTTGRRSRPDRGAGGLRPDRTGPSWFTRIGVVAAGAVLVPALATVALTGPAHPGGGTGPSDPTELALTAQTSLMEQAGRYRQLEQEAADARARLDTARAAEEAARVQLGARQRTVGTTAAEIFMATAEDRYPGLGLDVADAGATRDVLHRQAQAELADSSLEGTVVRAERAAAAVTEAVRRVADAESALEEATQRAADALAGARATVDGLSTEVSLQLAALGTVPAPADQQARNDRAVARWQAYLGRLAQAGIQPPSAAVLNGAELPPGFSPVLDGNQREVPGVAWAIDGNEPVTVVPAETVAAVSTALSQLGKPFAPGTAGPDTYDCGGFTSSTWLLAGYAMPASPQDQWAAGTVVPMAHLQFGDLVFSPGGRDVGVYVGDGDVVGASAGTYRVSVRPVAAGSSAVRVTLPGPAEPNAALPGGGLTGPCGAPLPEPGATGPQWGGWANGRIPSGALCELGVHRHALRCDAAVSYQDMSAAYQATFGRPLCITDSYRSLRAQESARIAKPTLAAVPGTSNHGWALAVDLCDGVNVFGTPQWTWMAQNAGRFGFVQPTWAGPDGDKPEPWHWEYGYIS